MEKFCLLAFVATFVSSVLASWYWPFGSDTADEKEPPRLSELMEPASLLIDEASDLATDGKVSESVEKYRRALAELDRIERENPERTKSAEFATIRNKRAYVNAAIDSMLLNQIKSNARAVAVSDTTELEKKLAAERAKKTEKAETEAKAKAEEVKAKAEKAKTDEVKAKAEAKVEAKKVEAKVKEKKVETKAPTKPLTKREQVIVDITNGDYAAAEILIREMLEAKPNSVLALNLKATMESRQGKLKEAEATLDQAIQSNPRSHFAYYNMAILMLQKNPDAKTVARRYYETGRAYGGPQDAQLEAMFK